MPDEKSRNSALAFVILGLDYGASSDEATAAFARAARRLKTTPDAPFEMSDLTEALHVLQHRQDELEGSVDLFRVPADPAAYALPTGAGVLDKPTQPFAVSRQTEPLSDAERDNIVATAISDVLMEMLGDDPSEYLAYRVASEPDAEFQPLRLEPISDRARAFANDIATELSPHVERAKQRAHESLKKITPKVRESRTVQRVVLGLLALVALIATIQIIAAIASRFSDETSTQSVSSAGFGVEDEPDTDSFVTDEVALATEPTYATTSTTRAITTTTLVKVSLPYSYRTFRGKYADVSYPSDWVVRSADKDSLSGTFYDTTIEPAGRPAFRLRLDVEKSSDRTATELADEVLSTLQRRPSFRLIGRSTFDDRYSIEDSELLEFAVDDSESGERVHCYDFFVRRNGVLLALLFRTPSVVADAWVDVFDTIAGSLTVYQQTT